MYKFIYKSICSWVVTTSRVDFNRKYYKKVGDFSFQDWDIMPRKLRTKNNVFGEERVVSTVNIEVLGSGAVGVPSTVMLCTDQGSYLINCGEGASRLANEYKFKFHKSPIAFITYPSWKNISGLVGLALAAQESNSEQFTIHGHSDIGNLFSSMNKFIKLRRMRVIVKDCVPSEEFTNGVISVKYVLLSSSPSSSPSSSSSSVTNKTFPAPSKDLCDNKISDTDSEFCPSEAKKFKSSEPESVTTVDKDIEKEELQYKRGCMENAVSFIFSCKKSPGKLIMEKCVEYGVPPGPLLGKLKSGEDVVLENGVTVRSADVTLPDVAGVSVIAVECPSEDFLDSLLLEPAFKEYQSTEDPAAAVIHFSQSDVIKHKKYQEWLNRFPKSTLHLFINEKNIRTGSVAIHRQQFKLHLLHPELFPLLDDSKIPAYPRGDDTYIQEGHAMVQVEKTNFPSSGAIPIYKDKIYFKCESNSFINGETLCKVYLKPKNPEYDYSRSIVLKKDEFLQEMFENDKHKEKLDESIKEIRDMEKKMLKDKDIYPKIVFLGTGSSKPSKVRNGSGILIFINEFDCIIFDCAESTFNQLVNFYGLKKARKILRHLHAIFISHMHIDHHWGLITLLKERKIAFDEEMNETSSFKREPRNEEFQKLFLLAPLPIIKWLTLFSEKFEDISDLFTLIPNSSLVLDLAEKKKNENEILKQCMRIYNFSKINTAPVNHCNPSFGISISHKKGWKITYSGDTRPCNNLAVIGKNSDILIHEATFENVFSEAAKIKQHSTVQEAIKMGNCMKAKFVLLTHFSQRYCYLPNIECVLENQNVGIAFDFMEVPYYSLPILPKLFKPLQFALSKYDEWNKTATESFLQKKEKLDQSGISWDDFPDLTKYGVKMSESN